MKRTNFQILKFLPVFRKYLGASSLAMLFLVMFACATLQAQTTTSGVTNRSYPITQLKSNQEALAAITSQFVQYGNIKQTNPTEIQASEMMKRARVYGAIKNQLSTTGLQLSDVLLQVFIENIEHPLLFTNDQKVQAFYDKQWPQEFIDVVNTLRN